MEKKEKNTKLENFEQTLDQIGVEKDSLIENCFLLWEKWMDDLADDEKARDNDLFARKIFFAYQTAIGQPLGSNNVPLALMFSAFCGAVSLCFKMFEMDDDSDEGKEL